MSLDSWIRSADKILFDIMKQPREQRWPRHPLQAEDLNPATTTLGFAEGLRGQYVAAFFPWLAINHILKLRFLTLLGRVTYQINLNYLLILLDFFFHSWHYATVSKKCWHDPGNPVRPGWLRQGSLHRKEMSR